MYRQYMTYELLCYYNYFFQQHNLATGESDTQYSEVPYFTNFLSFF